jgi:REP element-mobilizing transposase RayT
MTDFLISLKRSKEIALAFGSDGFEKDNLKNQRERYDEIVAAGFAVLKTATSRFYQKEEKKLLNRLKKHRDKHFWAKGYYVDTVGRNEEQIRRYIKDQEETDKLEK